MAGRKKQAEAPEPSSNYETIKEQVVTYITGQEPNSKEEINYTRVLARVTLALIALYGIGRIRVLRQVAFSIATAVLTKWVADKAVEAIAPEAATA